jgi:hypothetical protein
MPAVVEVCVIAEMGAMVTREVLQRLPSLKEQWLLR